jgi:hypothetical protein
MFDWHDLHDAQVAVNHGKMDGFSHETYSLDHHLQHVLSQELDLAAPGTPLFR